MRENGSMIKPKEKGSISIKMARHTLGNGLMTSSTATGTKNGQMEHSTRATMSRA